MPRMPAATGERFGAPLPPLIPGHGGIGRVSAIGAGMTRKHGNREDLAQSLGFAADGKVGADVELQPLSAIKAVFARLAHGDVPARVVLQFP